METVGIGQTSMYTEAVSVKQPALSFPVTVYRVEVRGETVAVWLVGSFIPAVGVQLYNSAPVATSRLVSPTQIISLLLTFKDIGWCTRMVTESEVLQPKEL